MLLTNLIPSLFLLFCTALCVCFCHTSRTRTWERDTILEQKDLKGVVTVSMSSTSLMKCSLFCIQECTIFTFNETTGSCLGFSTFVPASRASTNDYKIVEGKIYNNVQKIVGPGCNTRIMVHDMLSNFTEASEVCALHDGHLLLLDTPAKQYCFMNTTGITARYWIGLTDIDSEGVWLWQNGIPFTLHSDSYKEQFNNVDSGMTGEFNLNADCGTVKVPYKAFTDYNCVHLFKFICER